MKVRLLLVGLSLVTTLTTIAQAQIDTPAIPPDKDSRDLFERVASADLVVVGTELRSKVVFRRAPPNDPAALEKSMSEGPKGQFFITGVERTVCRKADFAAQKSPLSTTAPQSTAPQSDDVIYIFVPQDEPLFSGAYQKEYLLPGRRYLLLLKQSVAEKVSEWARTLEVEPGRLYYRTLESERGVIPLHSPTEDKPNPEQPALLAEIMALCQAVKPKEPTMKIERLKKLLDSPDPVIRTEAEKAIRKFQGSSQSR